MTPPAHASIQAKVIYRACLIVGGIDQLALKLEAQKADVERWIRGEEEPPQRPFLVAVEIVLLYLTALSAAKPS
jgi:hypothetical protein